MSWGPPRLCLMAVLAGCVDPADPVADGAGAAVGGAPVDAGPAAPFTIVVLPDTQFYAEAYPEIFRAQTDWILAHREKERIAFVLHEGDIVNFDFDEQWAVAAQSLHPLDGKVPYVLAAGNHDLSWKGGRLSRDADLLNHYFPASQLASFPWPTGTFEPGRMESHYQVLDALGSRWLVLALEYGPRDAVLEWADQVLARHRELPAIVVTHAYLSDIHGRYNRTNKQPFWPCHDRMDLGGCNDGEDLWRKVLSRHDNVVFVFSGHVLHPGAGRLTSAHPSGRRTHQMLANYQTCAELPCTAPGATRPTRGGDGFLRLVRVDPEKRTALVETYSPYLDEWKTDDPHRFTLELDAPVAARAAPGPRPVTAAAQPAPPRGCDGVHLVLKGVEAIGTPGSVSGVRACLDGVCESFVIDPGSLACRPARAQTRVTCANDEGVVRLFFFEGLSARQRVSVTAQDAQGRRVFATERTVAARLHGGCWTARLPLDP